jgi:cell division control protein 6
MGLRPNAVDDTVLREIADAAAGDARVAIGILQTAARLATL